VTSLLTKKIFKNHISYSIFPRCPPNDQDCQSTAAEPLKDKGNLGYFAMAGFSTWPSIHKANNSNAFALNLLKSKNKK
jgi:hypothetical protein